MFNSQLVFGGSPVVPSVVPPRFKSQPLLLTEELTEAALALHHRHGAEGAVQIAQNLLTKFGKWRNMEKVNNLIYDDVWWTHLWIHDSNYDCKSHIIIIIEWTLVCLHAFCIRPGRLASTWVQLDGWQWWDLGSNLVAEKGAERVSKCMKGSIQFAATFTFARLEDARRIE